MYDLDLRLFVVGTKQRFMLWTSTVLIFVIKLLCCCEEDTPHLFIWLPSSKKGFLFSVLVKGCSLTLDSWGTTTEEQEGKEKKKKEQVKWEEGNGGCQY